MSNFKPELMITMKENYTEPREPGFTRYYENIFVKRFSTYRELLKVLKKILSDGNCIEARVSRSLRGEWGEWFEYWEMIQGRPKITKQGWL